VLALAGRRGTGFLWSLKMSRYDCWELVEACVNHADRVLLYGPPGTGKTYTACRDREDLFSVTITEDMSSAELRGHYVPRGGDFVWVDGPALAAFRLGKRVVLNEIDHAGADAMTFLHSILDDAASARITLPTGETVRRGEGFSAVATMNGRPDDLPAALRDRFRVAVEVTRPHPDAIAALPADLQSAAQGTCVHDDPARRIPLRAWLAYAALRQRIPNRLAAAAVFGPERADDVLESLTIAAG
jgi:MoxR-like ATPase